MASCHSTPGSIIHYNDSEPKENTYITFSYKGYNSGTNGSQMEAKWKNGIGQDKEGMGEQSLHALFRYATLPVPQSVLQPKNSLNPIV